MFAMVIGISLATCGGVLLSSYGGEKYSDKSNISVGEGDGNQNVQSEATLPERSSFKFDATGGTITYSRDYQIGDMTITNYGYGFEVNPNGYLESQNKGVSSSFAMLKIYFFAYKSSASFTIRYISYGESNYDYAIFGNLDQTLSASSAEDSTYYKRTHGESSADEKSLTYSNIAYGSHEIYIKYRKDGSVNSGNDTLQLFFENDYYYGQTAKWHYKGMQYGTLPTATKPGYEFKGWYANPDNNMVPPLSTWTLSGGATYDSATGIVYLPNSNSRVDSPLIYVGDTDINTTLTWYASAEFMCPTAATSTNKQMFHGGAAYYNANKVNYSGNGWADDAMPGVWTSFSFSWKNSTEWLGSDVCQWLSLDFIRNSTWSNDPYYVRNVRFWLEEDKGRKVESHHTIESFSTLYAHWEPIKYAVSFDAPNLFEDADYVMYRCEGDVTQWVNENGQQRTTVKFTEWTESYSCGIYFYADKLIAGEKYIWRAEVKSTLSHTMSIGYEMGGYTSVNVSTEWQIFEKEFTATDTGGVPAFSFYYGFSVGEVLDIAGMTVQKKSDVSFDKAVESLKKPYENTYGYLPTPTRANYTFSGWKNTHNYFINPSTKITYDKATTWKDGWHFCNLKDLGIYLTSGKAYRFSFDMKLISGTNQPWNSPTLFINGNTSGMLTNEDGSTALKNVTNSWQRYTGTFTYQADTTSNSYRHDTVHIYPRYNDDASLQGQITNLEIVEENIITSSTKMSVIGNHVLKAEWTPIAVTHNVKLMTISMNGNDVSESGLGGSVVVYRYSINGSTSSSGTYYQAESSASYTVHKGHTFELTARVNSGYVFAGFSTSSTPSEAIKNPSRPPSTTLTNYPTTNTNYYVYFKKVSDNRLKYDETDKYFYFEDGYYPQSYACWYNPSLHTDTGERIEICDPSGKYSSLKVYKDSAGQRYALVVSTRTCRLKLNGENKYLNFTEGEQALFKFEPIRWRISDYGVAKTERNIANYTTLLKFKNYTSFSDNFIAMSDMILGVGAMHNTRALIEGDSVQDFTGFQTVQNLTDNMSNDSLRLTYNRTGNIINVDQYSGYGSGQTNAVNKNNTISYSAPFRITSLAELNEVGFVNRGARASDMVCLILGLDTDKVSYWTRDLSNLGAGIAITPTGTQIRPWLDEFLGMRFAYNFREASNVDFYS